MDRGVVDVKFTWAPDASLMPAVDVVNSVCDFLEAYIDGRYAVIDRIGDTVV